MIVPDETPVESRCWPWSIESSERLDRPSVTAGNRVYSVSTQHGDFQEIGWRQPKEMSGVWDPPIKLLDGFWFGISPATSPIGPAGNVSWLTKAERWRLVPGEVAMQYRVSHGARTGSSVSAGSGDADLLVARQEYGVDDQEGLLVRLRLQNQGAKELRCVLHILARTDLRTAWLGEQRLTWRDGEDEAVYLEEQAAIAAYNTVNPAYVLFGAQLRPVAVSIGNDLEKVRMGGTSMETIVRSGKGKIETAGGGIWGHLRYDIVLAPAQDQEVQVVIVGSTRSGEAALATFIHLRQDFDRLADRQCQRYRQLMERNALHGGDELMEMAFGWAKLNLQMLERNVPGIGQGLSAGLPDFPWWFGKDTAYAVLALVASGQFELAQDSLRNLMRHSQAISGDGGVVHEILTQGHIYDTGHLVEVPLFVRACAQVVRWTGDLNFLNEVYRFCRHGLLDYVLGAHTEDGDLCARGKGMIETRELQYGTGFKTLDIAAYTYDALLCLAQMAEVAGDEAFGVQAYEQAHQLREQVNGDWWIAQEGLFGDIYTSARELAEVNAAVRAEKPVWLRDVADVRETARLLADFDRVYADDAEREQQRPWLLKHMIAATPMEVALATPERAQQAFMRLESDEFTGPWGLYLNPERERVVMTLPNGIMATAEAQYGRMERALAYSRAIAATAFTRMPGAFSEISPDDGCFIQAWSAYGIIWPVVHHFFGFRPDAVARTLRVLPHFPPDWHEARLQDVRVGETHMTVEVTTSEQQSRVLLETQDASYQVIIGCGWSGLKHPREVTCNGRVVVDYEVHTPEPGEQADARADDPVCRELLLAPMTGLHRYEVCVTWSAL